MLLMSKSNQDGVVDLLNSAFRYIDGLRSIDNLIVLRNG